MIQGNDALPVNGIQKQIRDITGIGRQNKLFNTGYGRQNKLFSFQVS